MEVIINKLNIIDDIKHEIANWSRCAVCSRVAMLKRVFYKNVCINCKDHWVNALNKKIENRNGIFVYKRIKLYQTEPELGQDVALRVISEVYEIPTAWLKEGFKFSTPWEQRTSDYAYQISQLYQNWIAPIYFYYSHLSKLSWIDDFCLPSTDPFVVFVKIWDAIVAAQLLVEPDEWDDQIEGITEPYEAPIKEQFDRINGDLDTLEREFLRCCCREYMGASRYPGYQAKWWAHVEEVVKVAKML